MLDQESIPWTTPDVPGSSGPTDVAAQAVAAWARERPDLDASPILVLGRLARAAAAVDSALRPPFAAAGLAPGDFDVLAALRRRGVPYAATPSALASATLVTQGATTKRVDRLVAQGLVTRAPAEGGATTPRDGRTRTVRLTPAGAALADRLLTAHLDNEARLLDGLDDDERVLLADLLLRLTRAAETATTCTEGTDR